MDKELIKAEIIKQEHTVTEKTVVKNGVNIATWHLDIEKLIGKPVPNIYIDFLIDQLPEDLNEKQAADFIIGFHNQFLLVDIDYKSILNPENILKGVYIALQQKSDENILKKDCQFDDLEQYLIYSYRDEYHIKLSKNNIDELGLNEEELWQKALEHTKKNIVFTSMRELIRNMPLKQIESMPQLPSDVDMFVLTNKSGYKGAGSILCKKEVGDYAKAYGLDRVALIPSTIHEWIIVNIYDENVDLKNLTEILRLVNDTEVDELERLSYKVYVTDLRG